MKKPLIIAIASVSAGGKTTVINELKNILKSSQSLHFDDYDFEGEVDDFHQWTIDGADYNVWNLTPLRNDIEKLQQKSELDYILLDYPFAYCNDMLKPYIDYTIFINTPLDIALARRVLRDFDNATADNIRYDMLMYLNYARVAYICSLETIMPNSDFVIDGSLKLDEIVNQIIERINYI